MRPARQQVSAADVAAAVRGFRIAGELARVEPHERGHIHDTFVSTWNDGGQERRYLHQRINEAVFGDVAALMHNVELVTRHLRERGARGSLELVPARSGESWTRAPSGAWRTYVHIDRAVSHDACAGPEMAFAAAAAFGRFQADLGDLDPAALRMTVPRFFSAPYRLEQLEAALAQDPAGRAGSVAAEVSFVRARATRAGVFDDLLGRGQIPARAVHGDTKLNNVLFDAATGAAVAIVDLDTCMPGWSLYDFGDLVRFTAAGCAEDEPDFGRARLDLALYRALADGYLTNARRLLTPLELELMPLAAWVVTLMIGARFLADHVAGDVYFKTARSGQNLDRARVQLALVAGMERQQRAMIVR